MAEDSFSRYLLLPELRLLETRALAKTDWEGPSLAEKVSPMEVCPRYATPSTSMYDRRWVRLKDEPLRLRRTILSVRKRRFWCGVPLHEPLAGVRKGYRTTERYRRRVLWACEHFIDLKSVRETYSQADGQSRNALPDCSGRALSSSCCAGLQLDFPAQQFQGATEVWVPFEEAIVIGWR